MKIREKKRLDRNHVKNALLPSLCIRFMLRWWTKEIQQMIASVPFFVLLRFLRVAITKQCVSLSRRTRLGKTPENW